MRNRLTIVPSVLLMLAIMLNSGGAWASSANRLLAEGDESKVSAALFPPPAKEGLTWHDPKGAGWEKRFFTTPLSYDNSSKNQIRSFNNSRIPLKAPGLLPGIAFDIEMHSFQALQSVVPPERWSKSFNGSQDQPLLVSPSNISPDYNGGFLRFIW